MGTQVFITLFPRFFYFILFTTKERKSNSVLILNVNHHTLNMSPFCSFHLPASAQTLISSQTGHYWSPASRLHFYSVIRMIFLKYKSSNIVKQDENLTLAINPLPSELKPELLCRVNTVPHNPASASFSGPKCHNPCPSPTRMLCALATLLSQSPNSYAFV